MCLGNRANNATHFVNSQLVAHWENARRCAEKHGNGLKPSVVAVEHATCLFEFYGPGQHVRSKPFKKDFPFFATFGAPHVEFVCNHEVILTLELVDGHYNHDTQKDIPVRELNERFNNYTVAFRVKFSTHTIGDFQCQEIGNDDAYALNLHILDTDSANFVPELSTFPGLAPASDEKAQAASDSRLATLIHYLQQYYLPTFKRAGFHVLHSLPDFDNLATTTAHIDYSVLSQKTQLVSSLYGITIEDVKAYLHGVWARAASHISAQGAALGPDRAAAAGFLVEHRTAWTDSVEDIHMQIRFNEIKARALCQREAVLYFNLQDVEVHIGGGFSADPHHRFSNWTIAIVVDVIYEELDEGHIKCLRFDRKTARYHEQLSSFPGLSAGVDLLARIRSTLVRYLLKYYLAILETSGHSYIYYHDSRAAVEVEVDPHGESESGSVSNSEEVGEDTESESDIVELEESDHEEFDLDECTCDVETSCSHSGGVRWGIIERNRLTQTQAGAFDVITAVTQGALNLHFKALWEAARDYLKVLDDRAETTLPEHQSYLAEWSFKPQDQEGNVFFQATFGAPRLQLVCKDGSQSVVLYLELQKGHLKELDENKTPLPESKKHTFSGWRVAFDVDLRLVDSSEVTVSEALSMRFGRHSTNSFKHLILDLDTLRFNASLSIFSSSRTVKDPSVLRARQDSVLYYLTTHYIPNLAFAQHHVLYTLPVFDAGGFGNHRFTCTSVKAQIVPFLPEIGEAYEGAFGHRRALYNRNAIVLLGMVGGRPLPEGVLALSKGVNLIAGAGSDVPHGTVAISRRALLEERILSVLQSLNADTTIVPCLSCVNNGEWILRLSTWATHEIKKELACHWKEKTRVEEELAFEWNNKEDWRYQYEGDLEGSGTYAVTCLTNNTVTVPTTLTRGTCGIVLAGKATVSLEFVGASEKWSAEMVASWTAVIELRSDASDGLNVQLSDTQVVPSIKITKQQGTEGRKTHEHAFENLRKLYPQTIDLSHIANELRGSFVGSWAGLQTYARDLNVANPVFNRRGDLLFELGMATTVQAGESTLDANIPVSVERDLPQQSNAANPNISASLAAPDAEDRASQSTDTVGTRITKSNTEPPSTQYPNSVAPRNQKIDVEKRKQSNTTRTRTTKSTVTKETTRTRLTAGVCGTDASVGTLPMVADGASSRAIDANVATGKAFTTIDSTVSKRDVSARALVNSTQSSAEVNVSGTLSPLASPPTGDYPTAVSSRARTEVPDDPRSDVTTPFDSNQLQSLPHAAAIVDSATTLVEANGSSAGTLTTVDYGGAHVSPEHRSSDSSASFASSTGSYGSSNLSLSRSYTSLSSSTTAVVGRGPAAKSTKATKPVNGKVSKVSFAGVDKTGSKLRHAPVKRNEDDSSSGQVDAFNTLAAPATISLGVTKPSVVYTPSSRSCSSPHSISAKRTWSSPPSPLRSAGSQASPAYAHSSSPTTPEGYLTTPVQSSFPTPITNGSAHVSVSYGSLSRPSSPVGVHAVHAYSSHSVGGAQRKTRYTHIGPVVEPGPTEYEESLSSGLNESLWR